jgi:hypothetical protein
MSRWYLPITIEPCLDPSNKRRYTDARWKACMRRQTVTVNWSRKLSLALGIEFN